ncbi:MAG TPA: HU family DNA-binding protein [Thermoanaerobaculia bacterium]|jgi:DNA-binding protein HU-beta|nr:HU family DNA-binding protein [Thermoanaerobaculia bacterium]
MAGRADIVSRVAERVEGLSRKQAAQAFDAIFETIEGLLKSGERVQITSFGSFSVADRAAREGRNPATGQRIQIPASRNAKFKPARELKESLS